MVDGVADRAAEAPPGGVVRQMMRHSLRPQIQLRVVVVILVVLVVVVAVADVADVEHGATVVGGHGIQGYSSSSSVQETLLLLLVVVLLLFLVVVVRRSRVARKCVGQIVSHGCCCFCTSGL